MRTAPRWLSLAFFACLLVGCSDSAPLVPVTGKVTLHGKPLKNVKVAFYPDPDKGTHGLGSSGTTDDAGNFTLTQDQGKSGAVVGHHRVVLTDLDVYGNVFVGRGDYRKEEPARGRVEVPKRPRFQPVYLELPRTPLQQEVKTGMGPVTYDVK